MDPTPQQIIRGMNIVTTEHKADNALVDELIEQLNDKEQKAAFPPSKEKAGTAGE